MRRAGQTAGRNECLKASSPEEPVQLRQDEPNASNCNSSGHEPEAWLARHTELAVQHLSPALMFLYSLALQLVWLCAMSAAEQREGHLFLGDARAASLGQANTRWLSTVCYSATTLAEIVAARVCALFQHPGVWSRLPLLLSGLLLLPCGALLPHRLAAPTATVLLYFTRAWIWAGPLLLLLRHARSSADNDPISLVPPVGPAAWTAGLELLAFTTILSVKPPKPTTECVYSILSTIAAALISTPPRARLQLGLFRFPPYAVQQALVTAVTLALATAAAAPARFALAATAPWRWLRRAAVALRSAAAKQQLPASAAGAQHQQLQRSASEHQERGALLTEVPLAACGRGGARSPSGHYYSPSSGSAVGVHFEALTHGSSSAGEAQTQRATSTGANAAGGGGPTDRRCSCGCGGSSRMSLTSSGAGATESSVASCRAPCRKGGACATLRQVWLQQQQQHWRDPLRHHAGQEAEGSPWAPGASDPATAEAAVGSSNGGGGGSCAATEITAQEIIASFASAMGAQKPAAAPQSQPLPLSLPTYRSRSKLHRLLLRPPSFPPGRSARPAMVPRGPAGMVTAAERGCISESNLPGSAPPKELLQRWDFGPDYFAGVDLTE